MLIFVLGVLRMRAEIIGLVGAYTGWGLIGSINHWNENMGQPERIFSIMQWVMAGAFGTVYFLLGRISEPFAQVMMCSLTAVSAIVIYFFESQTVVALPK